MEASDAEFVLIFLLASRPTVGSRRSIAGRMRRRMGIWLLPTGVDIGLPALVQQIPEEHREVLLQVAGGVDLPPARRRLVETEKIQQERLRRLIWSLPRFTRLSMV